MSLLFWIVTVLLLFFFIFILWMRRGLSKIEEWQLNPADPDVSVVVAARNEAGNLPGLLATLAEQSYPKDKLEIIIVDDQSIDGTQSVLAKSAEQMANLKSLRQETIPAGWAPKKWALASGIAEARGELILTTDADCLPPPGWVEAMVRPFAAASVGMVSGPAPLVPDKKSLWGEILSLDSYAMNALGAAGTGHGLSLTAIGRNLAYRKVVYDELKGFEGIEHLISGDDELLMQKMAATGHWQFKYVLNPAALVTSPTPATFKEFYLQRMRYGSKGMQYFILHTGPWFKGIVILFYLANLAGVVSLAAALATLGVAWLIPVALKLVPETLLVALYLKRIKQRIRPLTFLLTGLLYPLYIAFFGTVGSFAGVVWKGRRFEGATTS